MTRIFSSSSSPALFYIYWLFLIVFLCCCHDVTGKRNCASNVCFNGGNCIVDDEAGVFQCECRPGFSGTLCESALPCSLDCRNGGLCSFDSFNNERCECPEGFTGDLCTSTADCQVTGCLQGEICLLDPSLSKWSCVIDRCEQLSPCLHNATCRPTRNSFICECELGFTGHRCEIDVDECAPQKPCKNNGNCVNLPGGFKCDCLNGFSGNLCEQRIGFCIQNPCGTHGQCFDEVSEYHCECEPGWTGKNCEAEAKEICECENPNHECIIKEGKPICECPAGTQGAKCDEPIDLCANENKCANGGQCIANGNSTFCICPSQFTGAFCESKIEDCLVEEKPCINGGKCIRGEQNNGIEAKCECIGRFMGKWCEQMRLNAHLNSTNILSKQCPAGYCMNGGKCKIERGQPKCDCLNQAFTGEKCERRVAEDLCDPNPCLNDGQCHSNGTTVSCFCLETFTGTKCEIPCDCGVNELCRESIRSPGSAECLTVPDPEIIIPDNNNDNNSFPSDFLPSETTNEIDVEDDGTTTNLITESQPSTTLTNFPIPSSTLLTQDFNSNNNTNSNFVDSSSSTINVFTTTTPSESLTQPSPTKTTTFNPNNLSSSTIITETDTFDELLNVTSCDSCVNAQRCLQMDNRYICLCNEGYTGAYCDEPSNVCSSISCNDGQVCRLQRTGSIDLPQCACAPGYFGISCHDATTASFKPSSILIYQSQSKPLKDTAEYSLILSFRTTVPNVHFVTGENLFGKQQFSLNLNSGFLTITIGNTPTSINDLTLDDGQWYTIWFNSTSTKITVEIEDSASGYILTRKQLQIKPLNIYTTRFGRINEGEHFTGCLRDAFINQELVDLLTSDRSVDIEPGCNRKEQCKPDTCQNGAACIDLWDKFRCECVRPFLEPMCVNQLREVTFGHDNASSLIEFSIDGNDSKLIRQKTDISFLIRTKNDNGIIAFLGNRSDDDDSVGTFLSVEMVEGKIIVNGRLGSKRIVTEKSKKTINDNKVHLIEIQRSGNDLRLKIDGKQDATLQFRHPFEHPLLADSLVLGDRTSIKQAAFSSPSGGYFKGTLQDLRINGKSVILADDPPTFNLESFGQKQIDQNILEGTVSDDICAQLKPCEQGKCFNTFNDFQCLCESGWIGLKCEKKDFCVDKPCPFGTTCENTHGGYVCTSTASFYPTSVVKYSLKLPETVAPPNAYANFTVQLRTRSKAGQVFKLQSSLDSIAIILTEFGLDIIYSNSTTSIRDPLAIPISDGQWHKFSIQEENSKLSAEFDTFPSSPLLAPFSLTRFGIDKNARLILGKGFNITGFKGCLQKIVFNDFPEISFLPKDTFAGNLNSVLHFVPIQRENIQSDGCHSTEVCGALNPCKNGASCIDHFYLKECRCSAGFEGEFCERNKDECAGHESCGPNGRCIDGIGEFACLCKPGFSGNKCETAIDQCRQNPCQNNGKCESLSNGTYSCHCEEQYFGRRCQQKRSVNCAARPCENNGTCKDSEESGVQCECPEGFYGPLCEDAIDACATLPCVNGGSCSKTPDGKYKCECQPEFTGDTCNQFADICHLSGQSFCKHGACKNIFGGALCTCDEGWIGSRCDIDEDECAEFPCANNGTCVNTAGGFRCECAPFYLGSRCEITGICATEPCLHGTCLQHSAKEHTCQCDKGFEGARCDEQIDYCRDEPCQNGATCQKLIGAFKCSCIAGFTGETCETDIDDCVQNACANGGKCLDRVNGFECACNGTGFKGAQCTEDINECSPQLLSSHCVNGLCNNIPGSYKCQCDDGYIGPKCNMVNPCLPDPLNRTLHNCVHGKCTNPIVVLLTSGREVAQHECDCFEGYTGPQCTHQMEKQYSIPIGYIAGPLVAIIVILCLLGCMLFFFVARSKRANQGHYSPSNQEQTGGARMQHFSDVHNGGTKNSITPEQIYARATHLTIPSKRPAPPPPASSVATTWAFTIHQDETL